jgi:hypothetical protein
MECDPPKKSAREEFFFAGAEMNCCLLWATTFAPLHYPALAVPVSAPAQDSPSA